LKPLALMGQSGPRAEMTEIAHFVSRQMESLAWDMEHGKGSAFLGPPGAGGGRAFEFDFSQETEVVYEKNGVVIRRPFPQFNLRRPG